jgi:hypothetical protein
MRRDGKMVDGGVRQLLAGLSRAKPCLPLSVEAIFIE